MAKTTFENIKRALWAGANISAWSHQYDIRCSTQSNTMPE